MPLHLRAREFVKSGLYSGLTGFEEFENRIVALGDNKTKGDAFEVFAEAYLSTQRKHDAEKVWPLSAMPLEVLQKLGLSEQDYGVDGVFLTLLGHHNAYQVKFRTGRNPLTWTELSTFMGLADSPYIRSRILFTNCDELPTVLNERQGFFCIRGSDLDRLQPEDFRVIESWLAESAFEIPRKLPQEHQTEALAALVPALRDEARVSAIMACGTGKTLVALWAAEQLQASRILVLLPSLALLRQTLHEWLRETNLPLAYLCVCSDPTVKEDIDTLATQQSDLDFEVSTNAKNVRQFLGAPFAGTKVVFSTYQSASVVSQAMKTGEMFDLGIFDEAHKTAGREGRNYGFALDDSNLLIRKRLFVTATPRHYNPHQRDREGDAQVVFSMDNPRIYGRQVFCLTFGEAARRNIICNFKVIISVITSEMVTNELLSRGEVMVNGDAIRARQVANQIALRDAVEKYGVNKIFTFHRTVKSAASFVADGSEGIGTHLPDFGSYHVNGDMPTARRERVMREFRGATRAVMSNARCLTEGVDVPAVDMVAFLSPRRSRVDIVQATGRAMRRAPGKALGYVLVPLYVELVAGESVEDAVRRADFDEVWDVLQSLQEQDEVLAEIIRSMAMEKGHRGHAEIGFGDRVEIIGPEISMAELQRAITSHCLENLAEIWDVRFGELTAYKEAHGDCLVPNRYKPNPQLRTWVNEQRKGYSKKQLSSVRIKRLEELGFEFDPLEAGWQRMYEALKAYREEYGHCRIPNRYKPNPQLAMWAGVQRRSYLKQKISLERIRRLEEIGFEWDQLEADWQEMFEALKTFKKEHGHCRIPTVYKPNPKLRRWVSTQRNARSKQKLSLARIKRLEEIGFEWDQLEADWQQMFDALKAFRKERGDCRVPQKYKPNPQLANWVVIQRTVYLKQKLSSERVKRLEEIGFEWVPLETDWQRMFEGLKAYKRKHGNCRVPAYYKPNPQLAQWVGHQRKLYSKHKHTPDHYSQLEKLGFEWDPFEVVWQGMFEALKAHKREYGHCRVPARYMPNPGLGGWTSEQRKAYVKQKLSSERIKRLEEIGFEWDQIEAKWERMFEALRVFKEEHGHCRVPSTSKPDHKLALWITVQRRTYSKQKLSPDHYKRLADLGFEFQTRSPHAKG